MCLASCTQPPPCLRPKILCSYLLWCPLWLPIFPLPLNSRAITLTPSARCVFQKENDSKKQIDSDLIIMNEDHFNSLLLNVHHKFCIERILFEIRVYAYYYGNSPSGTSTIQYARQLKIHRSCSKYH